MKNQLFIALLVLPIWMGCASTDSKTEEVPNSPETTSLLGEALYPPPADSVLLEKWAAAQTAFEANPADADLLIWYGRRTGYLGRHRDAIAIFAEGIEKHPNDARMYRHRGHRYISIREFDRAIADLERAVQLIEGQENEIEPDGMPNAQNIPVSSLHGNIWYHLGLAYYLKQDWENALRAYQAGYDLGENDDNRVSTTHWRYMILRRMGRHEEAQQILADISADMQVIENTNYHRLCLFYKGEIPLSEMMASNGDSPENAAEAYGVANWHLCNGDTATAVEQLKKLAESEGWSAFGVIAAEADLAARGE